MSNLKNAAIAVRLVDVKRLNQHLGSMPCGEVVHDLRRRPWVVFKMEAFGEFFRSFEFALHLLEVEEYQIVFIDESEKPQLCLRAECGYPKQVASFFGVLNGNIVVLNHDCRRFRRLWQKLAQAKLNAMAYCKELGLDTETQVSLSALPKRSEGFWKTLMTFLMETADLLVEMVDTLVFHQQVTDVFKVHSALSGAMNYVVANRASFFTK